ncbi:MAG TPA: hypothetical protein VMV32_02580 [Ignavibacteriaceae bacterium]|nr:hypothetical protein [Ignavibacteriaceae bacterium]
MKDQTEKFDYIIESYTNGNFDQVKSLFNRLRNDDKLTFLTYLQRDELETNFKLDLVIFLLRKRIDG